MNEAYYELLIKRQMGISDYIKRFLMATFAVCLSITLFVALGALALVFAAFVIYLTYLVFRNTNKEYEYQFFGGEFNVDIIYSRSKRKIARSFDLPKLEVFAELDSDKLSRYKNNPNVKILDYTSHMNERKLYAFIFPKSAGILEMVVIEPDEGLLNAFKSYAPSKVFI